MTEAERQQRSNAAKARHDRKTPAERSAFARYVVSSRWANSTDEERLAEGAKLARARAAKRAAAK